jgi:hypothetical protein
MPFEPILLVTRQKYLVLTHWGVRFPDGTVYEYAPGVGLRKTNDEGFAQGHDVSIVGSIPWDQAHIVRARLFELQRNPRAYDAFNWNCETFARWLTSGEAKSEQVFGVLLLAGFFAVFLAAAR